MYAFGDIMNDRYQCNKIIDEYYVVCSIEMWKKVMFESWATTSANQEKKILSCNF